MKTYRKKEFPVAEIRRLLEPGPIVLVSSGWKDETNIMTMGWHTVLDFVPSLIGCMITAENHSFDLIKRSGECVINIPELHMADTVVDIGNCSGREVNKFEKFNLTKEKASLVKAPLIVECYAHLECRLHDSKMVNDYNFFIFEVVKAHAPSSPKYPKTIHYRGNGQFMVSGKSVSYKNRFLPQNL
jgi:flavin reductase (DIM6/NTAB) family NADH-FMN oxidoreductase RutF